MDFKTLLSLLAFVLICIVQEVNAVHVFNVYRMLQFDVSQKPSYGAQRTSINSLAVTANTKLDRLERYVVMVPAEKLTIPLVEDIIGKRGADGLVILLPNDTSTLKNNEWQQVEKQLIQQRLPAAIYFAHWDEKVRNLYEELNKDEMSQTASLIGADSYRLEVPPPDASPIKDVNISTIQGWLTGNSKNTRPENLPTVAIVAYTDSFSAAPALSYGADSNGSGMVALLELARIFSKLYKNQRTHGEFNLLFLLSGGGRMNFAGSKMWLDKTDSRIVDGLDAAICLDTIGSAGGLNVHVSRTDKDPKAKKLFEIFQTVSEEFKVPIEIVHKKVNVSSTEIPWEHELFALRRVFGVTVSNLPKAESPMLRADIADRSIDLEALKMNIEIVGEVLARYIYNVPSNKVTILQNEFGVSDEYIKSWSRAIAKYPRMMPHFTRPATPTTTTTTTTTSSASSASKNKEKEPENYFLQGLERELARYVSEVTKKTWKLENFEYIHYDKIQAEMSAFRGKPVAFDVILSILIIVYLGALFTILKGPQETQRLIRSLFTNSKKRR